MAVKNVGAKEYMVLSMMVLKLEQLVIGFATPL